MASPYIEFHIDFDEDKILESDEEVSGDIASLILTRGKDVMSNRAPAATLNLNMRDNSHKYTPINSSSPLHPFQLPGPDCRLRMAYPYDSFTDTNSTALNGRALPKADFQTRNESEWNAWVADSSYVIESNHLEMTNATGTQTAVLDFETPNARIGADIKLDTHSSFPFQQSLFVFRWEDNNNYCMIYVNFISSTEWGIRVGKIDGGSFTHFTSDVSYDLADGTVWDQGDVARVEASFIDEEVFVWINDYAVAEYSGANFQLDKTKHGIGGPYFSTTAVSGTAGSRVVQWDNFGGWVTMFSGRTDTVEPRPGDDPSANISAWDDFERLNRHPVFSTAEPTKTAKALIDIVLEAGGVPADRPLLNGGTPVTDLLTIADTGQTLLTGFAKAMGATALEDLYQIADDDVGFVWIDGRGTYRYEASNHRDTAPHDTHHATWEAVSSNPNNPYISRDPRPRWLDGKDIVENEIYYKFSRAAKAIAATVWLLEQDDNPNFQAAPATTLSTWLMVELVALDKGNTIGKILNPVPTTDFTIFENANSTGVNYLTPMATNSGTVTMVDTPGTTVWIDDAGAPFGGTTTIGAGSFSDENRLIVVKDAGGNTAVGFCVNTDVDGDDTKRNITDWPENYKGVSYPGSPGWLRKDADFSIADTPLTFNTYLSAAYVVDGFEGETAIVRYLTTDTFEDSNFLTAAQLKADQTVESNPTAARAEDATSQAKFGRRRVDHQTRYIDTWAIALGRAKARLALRKDERERFIVNLHNSSKANLMEILYRDVSDRIRINYSDMGMTNRNYWIESYVLSLSDAGKRIAMEFTLSKVV